MAGWTSPLAFTPDLVAVFVTLFVLEVVLGVDNVIFISILASKLPKEQQARARNLGLTLAMVIRVVLVFFAGWIITLKEDVVVWFGIGFSGRTSSSSRAACSSSTRRSPRSTISSRALKKSMAAQAPKSRP